MHLCMNKRMCDGVRRSTGGDGGVSGISEMVESSVKRLCSATDVPR